MAISFPVFYLQHRNRAKIQIHLSSWNLLLQFPISLFPQQIFFSLFLCSTPDKAAIPVQPALTASVKACHPNSASLCPLCSSLFTSERCDPSAAAGPSAGTRVPLLQELMYQAAQHGCHATEKGDFPSAVGTPGSWRGQHCSEEAKSSRWTPFQKTVMKPKIPLMTQDTVKLPMLWRTRALKQIPV